MLLHEKKRVYLTSVVFLRLRKNITESIEVTAAINAIIMVTYCGIVHVSCVPFRLDTSVSI